MVVTAVAGRALLEERLRLVKFPEYTGYMQRTRRLIPGLF
jgi:protein-S-isoprenylcysteine O-methyltransferase Ste14